MDDQNFKFISEHSYSYLGTNTGHKAIVLFIFFLLPLPLVFYFLFPSTQIHLYASYKLFFFIGLAFIPYNLWRNPKLKSWHVSLAVVSTGIVDVETNHLYAWSSIVDIENIKNPDPEFIQAFESGIRLNFNDGRKLRIFRNIRNFDTLLATISNNVDQQLVKT